RHRVGYCGDRDVNDTGSYSGLAQEYAVDDTCDYWDRARDDHQSYRGPCADVDYGRIVWFGGSLSESRNLAQLPSYFFDHAIRTHADRVDGGARKDEGKHRPN